MSSTYASRSPSLFYALLWKESMQLLPLLLALIGVSTLLHAVLALIPGGKQAFPAFLFLIPNIFALGAPPMAIGQEEESGTLRWLRGLPVDWRWIAGAKAGGALAGLAFCWLFSLAIVTFANIPRIIGGSEVFSVEAIGGITYACGFSLYLLSCGFVMSWWLRSPLPSLLIMLPLMTVLFMSTIFVARMLSGRQEFLGFHLAVLYAVIALLVILAAALARRTLCRPWVRRRGRRWTAIHSAIPLTYEPVYSVPLHSPGRRFALLWQAFAQTWLVVFLSFCVGIVLVMILFLLMLSDPRYNLPDPRYNLPLAPLSLGVLITTILGAMVFATDNAVRRHRFLADRGIGPYTIWWTRQALPLTATILLAVPFSIIYALGDSGLTGIQLLLLFASAYACGQLTGQAFRRPIVGLLAAPVAFVATYALAFPILMIYPTYDWAAIASVGLLWLVTLRLCRRWSEERLDAGYYARLAGWIGLAALAFVGTIATVRYAATPSAVPGWHEETLALVEGSLPTSETNRSPLLSRDPQPRLSSGPGQRFYDVEELRKTAEEVVTNEQRVLGRQALSETAKILGTLRRQALEDDKPSAQGYQSWLRAMLLSSRRIYQSDVVWAEPRMGDQFESLAIDELLRSDSRDLLGASAWKELVELIPSSEEREQGRRNSILRGWLIYQHDPRYLPFYLHSNAAELRRLIPAEQWRTGRLLDRAVRISLEQLEEGLPPEGSPKEETRLQAWRALSDDEFVGVDYASFYGHNALPTSGWTPELNRKAERLREIAADDNQRD